MENIFSILYKYKSQSNMTPEENYFTESLKFILSLDSGLCNKFVKFISNGNKFNAPFSIKSQVRHGNSIIDLEIIDKNQKKIFIEVKLRAHENWYFSEDGKDDFGQVEKYSKLNIGYVCFISQGSDDIEIKTNKNRYLGQFEWFQIYELIEEYYKKSNNLKELNLHFLNNFLKFMDEQLSMKPFKNFTKQEIKFSQGTNFEFYSKLCNFIDYVKKDKQLVGFLRKSGLSMPSKGSHFNNGQLNEIRLAKEGWNCSIGFGLAYVNSNLDEKYKGKEGIYYYTYAWISKERVQKIKTKYKKFNLNKKYFLEEFPCDDANFIAYNEIQFSELMKGGEKKAIDYIYKSLLELKKKGVIKAMDWAIK